MSAFAARLEDDGCLGAMAEQVAALKARTDAVVAAVGQLPPPPAGQGSRGTASCASSDGAALPKVAVAAEASNKAGQALAAQQGGSCGVLGATGAAPTGATGTSTDTSAGQATRGSSGAALPEVGVTAEASHNAGQALAAQRGGSCGVAVPDSTGAAHRAGDAADGQGAAAEAQAQSGNAAAQQRDPQLNEK